MEKDNLSNKSEESDVELETEDVYIEEEEEIGVPYAFSKNSKPHSFKEKLLNIKGKLLLPGIFMAVIIFIVIVGGIIVLVTDPAYSDEHKFKIASGENGAVASDHEMCSDLGLKMLKNGGSAVDGAITVTLCLGILNPFSAGIGGGAAATVYRQTNRPDIYKGIFETYDCRETAPAAATENMFVDDIKKAQVGGLAIATPGEISGLYKMWKKHGKLKWASLFEPVIPLAKAHRMNKLIHSIVEQKLDDMKKFDKISSIYLNEDRSAPKELGEWIHRPLFAKTLSRIAEDPLTYYQGDLAEDIVDDITQAGGIVTRDDLRNYTTKVSEPLCTNYRGYEICGPKPEISGPSCIQMALNILEGYKLSELSRKDYLFYTIEAMKYAFGHRMHLGDPAYTSETGITVEDMLAPEYASKIRSKIKKYEIHVGQPEMYTWNHTKLDPIFDHGTTHFSVVDRDGLVVSMTSTINLYFGSMVVGEKTGIIFNDEMDDFSTPGTINAFNVPASPENYIAPGKRPMSSMSPMIVLKDNQFYLATGGAGGTRIISATYQTILNVLVREMNMKDAIYEPRVHHQTLPEECYVEPNFKNKYELKELNYKTSEHSIAVVQGIMRDPTTHIYTAVSDPRKSTGQSYAY
mmetsp:Transcript_522/g.909  ORF Transcript_522/g.909 Transcript_522/m.909 type:complete len:632 (+) Transcript_522:2-1897(+)